jgi:hypothetical protein
VASFATAAYWVLLGAPLIALSAGIRQDAAAGLVRSEVFIAAVAWAMAQIGLWLGTAIESEFSRALVHWAWLLVVFVATLALPAPARILNPVLGLSVAQNGTLPAAAYGVYVALGLAGDTGARFTLRRYLA